MPNRIKDLTGQKFNKLTVLEMSADRSPDKRVIWICKCDCGNLCQATSNNLKKGSVSSCGCNKRKDLTGQRFGKLTVIKDTEKRISQKCILWLCRCDCGNYCEAKSNSLLMGDINSCGCLKKENDYLYMSKKRNVRIIRGTKISSSLRYQINKFVKNEREGKNLSCFICKSKRRIHLHHLWGVNNKPELAMVRDNLIELCSICHKDFHLAYGLGMNTPFQFIEFYENYI